MMDVVVVLPLVPVTPSIVNLRAGLPKAELAAIAAARRPSLTTITGRLVRL